MKSEMKLEEAIKYLEKVIQVNNSIIEQARKNGDINVMQLTADLDTQIIAIETVLKELENKDKQIQKLQAVNKMQDYRINEMDIPRKKIKDKIKKLEKKKRDLSPFGMGKIEGLYELLEEK